MIAQIIIAIAFLILTIIILIISISTEKEEIAYLSLITAVIWITLTVDFHDNIPKAMDVYQGKTTLKIIYEDGIPIDSVVVFKKKIMI